jgi:dienelactone hydrolase
VNKVLFLALIFYCFQLCAANNTFQEIEFVSGKIQLSGTIVYPNNVDIHSAVVFVHGSGKQTRSLHWAERFASNGIVALVYDKRGVGLSGGEYESKQSVSEKNLELLAQDAAQAFNVLRKHPKTKNLSVGLTGISQAGWIVPLAAQKSDGVDFIVLWSGPVTKVSEEDIFSKYTTDLDGKQVSSYAEALASRKHKYIWPDFLGRDTNPLDSLAKLNISGLWVFGENDGSIPVDLSMQRISKLKKVGHKYDYVLFSGVGHNNMNETFATVADWINRLPR